MIFHSLDALDEIFTIITALVLLRITTVPISLRLLLSGQFQYMKENGYQVITVSAAGDDVSDVLKEGVKHIAIPFTRQITPFQDLKCLLMLIRVIRQTKPDIIHTHTPKAGLLGMLAGRICGVPLRMHTVAGLPLMEAKGLKRKLLEFTEYITYASAHGVYPNSVGLKRFILDELKADPAKIKVIASGSSNGIDTQYFSATPELNNSASEIRKRYGVHEHDIVFSFVGRIVKDKGIIELVSAFKQLPTRDDAHSKKYFLMLVGPFEEDLDPLPADVMTFVRQSSNVILAGFQKDVRPWLMASDVFVFPSYREGFPNVVMQASLLEVPCIVSDINGCNEIIQHQATGLIVPPKSDTALKEAMMIMADDPALRQMYATSARRFVADNYDRIRVWEAIVREYRKSEKLKVKS